ncbi:MAG TPA: PHP-associated domain-containing protein [Candidatus Methanomethylophilaceae archaeon]|nr:PHP-associated domain-containing protein [Candidatus Methanomethylophilaceae archaeon]
METTLPEMNDRVAFRKPDIKKKTDLGMTCVDMHFHTHYSDSYTQPRDTIKLAEKRGVGVAITDHNQIGGVLDAIEMDSDVLIIPGIEISASDGPHILTYFYDWRDLKVFWDKHIKDNIRWCQWIALRNMPTTKLLDILEDENCLVSAAHPMGYLGSNKGMEVCIRKNYIGMEDVERLDAYEVISGGISRKANKAAYEAALKYGIGTTGGTDGHLLPELGNIVTVSEHSDVDGFLDSIRKKRNCVIGREKDLITKAIMGAASLTEFCRHTPSVGFVQLDQTIMNAKRKRNPPADNKSEKTGCEPADRDLQ